MELEQRLREGLAAPDPGLKFTEEVMTRVRQGRDWRSGAVETTDNRNRVRNRFIVIGTVAALAVAAAMLAVLLSGDPDSSAMVAADVTLPQPAEPPAAMPVETPPAEPATPLPASEATAGFIVAVLPLRHESRDAAGRPLLEAFRAALLEELRKVPGLTLKMQDTMDPAAEQDADYLLAVASVAETVLPSGHTATRSSDGRSFAGSAPGSGLALQGEVMVRPTARQSGAYNDMFPLGDPDNGELRKQCEQMPAQFHERFCVTAEERAAQQVERLRSNVFPPDPSWQRGMIARLLDVTRNNSEREDAMWALLSMHGRGLRLDAGAISGIVDHVAAMRQDQRKNVNVWRQLPLATEAGFLPPLLDVLRRHPDVRLRLEVLMTLAESHVSDPRVRTTLAALMGDDSPPTLRMAARRTLAGEAEWNRYVVATLLDADLPVATRLEPLQIAAQWKAPANAAGMAPLVNDQEVVAALLGMARDGLSAPGQAATTRQVLELLKDAEDPAVTELFLQLAQDRSSPSRGSYALALADWMVRHKNDPRVSRILDENAARGGIPLNIFDAPPR